MKKPVMYSKDPPTVESYMREFDPDSDDMFKKYILYAIKLARRYYLVDGWMPGDVVQRAMTGLFDATREFDPDKGVAFVTFAHYYILGRIKEFERNKADKRYRRAVSVDDPVVSDNLVDRRRGAVEAFDDEDQVSYLLPFLNKRQRKIVKFRFGFTRHGCCTLRQIGEKFGLSRERIRQILRESLKRMLSKGIRMNEWLLTLSMTDGDFHLTKLKLERYCDDHDITVTQFVKIGDTYTLRLHGSKRNLMNFRDGDQFDPILGEFVLEQKDLREVHTS